MNEVLSEVVIVLSTCGMSLVIGFFFRVGWLVADAAWKVKKHEQA